MPDLGKNELPRVGVTSDGPYENHSSYHSIILLECFMIRRHDGRRTQLADTACMRPVEAVYSQAMQRYNTITVIIGACIQSTLNYMKYMKFCAKFQVLL